jgi:hypothetical protein
MTSDIKWCINNASTLSIQNFTEAFNYGDKTAANTKYSMILTTKTFQTNGISLHALHFSLQIKLE